MICRIFVEQNAEQERQLRLMKLDIENYKRQLSTASNDREHAIQENRKLQDDLAAVLCDVRRLETDLQSARSESCDLKHQLQIYTSQVRRAEEQLNRKVCFVFYHEIIIISLLIINYFLCNLIQLGVREVGNAGVLQNIELGGNVSGK